MANSTRRVVNITEAKVRLSELVERASRGKEIILARNGKPRAKLVSLTPEKKKYVFGAGKGKWKGLERLLEAPLPENVMDLFLQGEVQPAH